MNDNLSLFFSLFNIITITSIIIPKGLNNEQLVVWLSNHPRLRGTDCQHDIRKLKRIPYNHVYISTLVFTLNILLILKI